MKGVVLDLIKVLQVYIDLNLVYFIHVVETILGRVKTIERVADFQGITPDPKHFLLFFLSSFRQSLNVFTSIFYSQKKWKFLLRYKAVCVFPVFSGEFSSMGRFYLQGNKAPYFPKVSKGKPKTKAMWVLNLKQAWLICNVCQWQIPAAKS